nr:alpha/beta fold hydrolase [Chthoniobacterales bacterium]
MLSPIKTSLRILAVVTLAAAAIATLQAALGAGDPASTSAGSASLPLSPCHVEGIKDEVQCGVFKVYENRRTQGGRMLPLRVVVIPARHPHPEQGPIFYMAGGPGEAATELGELIIGWGDAEEHDVVLVDERGTGEGHRLDCPSPHSDDDLEGYLNGPFDPAAAKACAERLSGKADLSQYSTANFVEDVDEVRQALGYDRININGGSMGTYAALMYIRAHGDHVRSAYLTSVATLSQRIPLYHADAAQRALDQLFTECEQDKDCSRAYPRLREDFNALMRKLHEAPVLTPVTHPGTGKETELHLTERAFGDAVRVMMYRSPREVPFLIEEAVGGNFRPFAQAAVKASRGVYSGAAIGLNFAVTCSELVSRIRAEEVEPMTRGRFLGSWRVKDQMAVSQNWPKTDLPANYFEPFRSDVPVVLVSGSTDPGMTPQWAEEAKSFMAKAVHVIVSGGAHTPENACTRSL